MRMSAGEVVAFKRKHKKYAVNLDAEKKGVGCSYKGVSVGQMTHIIAIIFIPRSWSCFW